MNPVYARLPIAAQNLACTLAGWRRARARFTPYFHRTLAELERTGWSSAEHLREIQWRRLRRLVAVARRAVPHYRALDLPPPARTKDAEKGIRNTLAALPVLEKEDYAADPRAFLASDADPRRLYAGKTSGTTGTALRLHYPPEALAEEYATVWRLRRSAGATLEDPHFSFGGQIVVPLRQERPPFWRRNHWSGQTLFSLYHMTPQNLPYYVEALHALPARYAQGYPSSLHLLGRALLEAGRPLPEGRLVGVFTSSESLLAFQRDTIERAFGAPVFDRYGTSEFCASMTSCSEKHLHVDMEFGVVEVEATEETERWVRGPLLATGFANDATPFLRYRIGDVGTRLKDPCPCGRPGEAFLDVDGRIEDFVVTPEGRRVGRLDHIFKDQHDVAEAQILQDTEASIEVLVAPRSTWTSESERALLKEIRSRLGDTIGVDVRLVEVIEREPNGKFRAVKSRVGRLGS